MYDKDEMKEFTCLVLKLIYVILLRKVLKDKILDNFHVTLSSFLYIHEGGLNIYQK